jgi:hypothetical protein
MFFTTTIEDTNRLLLVMVLAASIFGAGFPVVAKKVKWVKVPAKAFFICKHFGTGVLIATAFVHVRTQSARNKNTQLTVR